MLRAHLKMMSVLALGTLIASPVLANDSQLFGTALGAGLGGLVGSSISNGKALATTTGVIVGGIIGNELTRPFTYSPYSPRRGYSPAYSYPGDMFPSDGSAYRPYLNPNSVEYRQNYVAPPSLPPPRPVIYVDETNGNYCRDFSRHIRVNDHIEESYGTACLQPDGAWHIMP